MPTPGCVTQEQYVTLQVKRSTLFRLFCSQSLHADELHCDNVKEISRLLLEAVSQQHSEQR